MKPIQSTIEKHGTLGTEQVALSFDEHSIAHLITVLTDLYSDSELAIIREYSTNALDSHIAAGQTRPIEVTLPTWFDQNFVVQDWGVGLSRDELKNIYSKYGASTKRNTNTQTGSIGVGCKSALTHTNQFTVTAVKDGVKTVISVSYDESGAGVMDLLESVYTDMPNGVKVEIPVGDYTTLKTKAEEFFSYWKPGTVLINGEEPSIIEGTFISDDIALVDAMQDVVIMGGVPYPVDLDKRLIGGVYSWDKPVSAVVWVPIGAVEFTPNRENLRYTEYTNKALSGIRTNIRNTFTQYAQNRIDACDTLSAAVQEYFNLEQLVNGTKQLTTPTMWRGQEIPNKIDVDALKFDIYSTRYQTETYNYLSLHRIEGKPTFIVGYSDPTNKTLTSAHKAKIRGMLPHKNSVYLVTSLPEWATFYETYEWEDVKAFKLNTNSVGVSMGPHPIYVADGVRHFRVLDGDLDTARPIYYTGPREDYEYYMRYVEAGDQVVRLGRNRWERFKRLYPTAQPLLSIVNNKRLQFFSEVPEDALKAMYLRDRELLKALDASMVDDPELVTQITLAKTDTSEWQSKFGRFSHSSEKWWGVDFDKKYPLIDSLWDIKNNLEHAHIYINAVYQKENK